VPLRTSKRRSGRSRQTRHHCCKRNWTIGLVCFSGRRRTDHRTDEFAGIKARHRQLHPPVDLSSRTRPQPGLPHSPSPAHRGDFRRRATPASQPSIALCWAQQKGRRVATSKHGPRTSERPSNHPTEKINYEHLDRSPPRISSSDPPAVREAPGHLRSLRGIQECGAGWREPRRICSVQRAAWSRGRPALPCRSIQSPHGRPCRSGSE